MSKTPQHASSPSAGDDRNLVTVDETYPALSFEDRLRLFWEKNSRGILVVCALVLALILGKGAYEVVSAQREKAIAADYAAATTDERLKAFVAEHEDHVLGGLAQLDLADKAYSSGNYAEARSAYDRAVAILKQDTFGQRARVGSAVSALQAGATEEGTAALKAIVSDLTLGALVRSEAAFHLATLAAANGDTAEAIRLIEQATTIDSDGPWADRATMLRASLPSAVTTEQAGAGDAAEEALPTVTLQ